MKLVIAAAERTHISQRKVQNVIEKFTGDDPGVDKWSFVVKERGARFYELLDRS